MTRALRSLALVTIACSAALAIYSFSQPLYGVVGDALTTSLSQLLGTTATALGLTLAVVALVANAPARRWGWFSVYLVLAIVTVYGPELLKSPPFVIWFLQFFDPFSNEYVYLQWVVLSFCVPPVATALVALLEQYGSRVWNFSAGPTEDEADNLEVTPL